MYLDCQEVAKRFGVATLTIRRQSAAGKFPKPIRVGRQLRWSISAIEKWESEQSKQPEPAAIDSAAAR